MKRSPFERAADMAMRGFLALLMFVFVLFLFNLATGCVTPRAGTPCGLSDEAHCVGGTVARSCQGGALVDFPCPGPTGCQEHPGFVIACDQTSGAQPGTKCLPENEGHAQCAPDAGSYLQCASGAWTQVACAQGTKCQDVGGVVACK